MFCRFAKNNKTYIMKYKEKPFWDRNVNPITGWPCESSDRSLGHRNLMVKKSIKKSLESYGKGK
jgi:hypothetical protein